MTNSEPEFPLCLPEVRIELMGRFGPSKGISGIVFNSPSLLATLTNFYDVNVWDISDSKSLTSYRMLENIRHLMKQDSESFLGLCYSQIVQFSFIEPFTTTKILSIRNIDELFSLTDDLVCGINGMDDTVVVISVPERKIVRTIKNLGHLDSDDVTTISCSEKYENCFYINTFNGVVSMIKLVNFETGNVEKEIKIGEEEQSVIDVIYRDGEEIALIGYGEVGEGMYIQKFNLHTLEKSDSCTAMRTLKDPVFDSSKMLSPFLCTSKELQNVISFGSRDLFAVILGTTQFRRSKKKANESSSDTSNLFFGGNYLFLEFVNKNSFRMVSINTNSLDPKYEKSHEIVKVIPDFDLSELFWDEDSISEEEMERIQFVTDNLEELIGEKNTECLIDINHRNVKTKFLKSLLL